MPVGDDEHLRCADRYRTPPAATVMKVARSAGLAAPHLRSRSTRRFRSVIRSSFSLCRQTALSRPPQSTLRGPPVNSGMSLLSKGMPSRQIAPVPALQPDAPVAGAWPGTLPIDVKQAAAEGGYPQFVTGAPACAGISTDAGADR